MYVLCYGELKMKFKLLSIALVLAVTGCSSTKPPEIKPEAKAEPDKSFPKLADQKDLPKLSGYEGPIAMSRIEVIQGQKECMYAKLKPNVEYVIQKTQSGKVLVPINIHCDPVMEK
jgi:hypothetical protein